MLFISIIYITAQSFCGTILTCDKVPGIIGYSISCPLFSAVNPQFRCYTIAQPYSVSAALKGVLKRVRQTRSWYRSWFSKPFVNCPMLRIYHIEASLQSRLKFVCYYRIWSFWNCIVLWLHLVWKTISYHRYLNGLQTACKKTIFNRLFKDSFSNRWSKRLTGCRECKRRSWSVHPL